MFNYNSFHAYSTKVGNNRGNVVSWVYYEIIGE